MMIPGLTLVQNPLETYLIVRDGDGDRELSPGECKFLYDLATENEKLRLQLGKAREAFDAAVATKTGDEFKAALSALGVVLTDEHRENDK